LSYYYERTAITYFTAVALISFATNRVVVPHWLASKQAKIVAVALHHAFVWGQAAAELGEKLKLNNSHVQHWHGHGHLPLQDVQHPASAFQSPSDVQ